MVDRTDIDPAYLRSHYKEFEDATCKIIEKEKASKIVISKLDEAIGCFVPIAEILIDSYNEGLFCNTDLFMVEAE